METAAAHDRAAACRPRGLTSPTLLGQGHGSGVPADHEGQVRRAPIQQDQFVVGPPLHHPPEAPTVRSHVEPADGAAVKVEDAQIPTVVLETEDQEASP